MLKCYRNIIIIILLTIVSFFLYSKSSVRIKDITTIQGIRENQLTGFGLVSGLSGNGDSKGFNLTKKMLQHLAENYGFTLTTDDINSKNIAAVLVTCTVKPFARKGENIDISISSIGDAKSLAGGILLQTPLLAANNKVYAVAQGRILEGKKSNSTQNTATIPLGAILERDIISDYIKDNKINLLLHYPDFVTATQIKDAVLTINPNLQVSVVDPGLIQIILGKEELKNPADFIAKFEILTVEPDNKAVIIINKKSGTIVTGENVVIQECSVSTPSAQVQIRVNNNKKYSYEVKSQTVGDFVKILNEMGLKSDEVISLLEAIHKAGAINAKLIIL